MDITNVKQGALVVVTLTIRPEDDKTLDNIIVVDMLPAGFEIENTRIRSHGELEFEPESNFEPAYIDIRDDRMLLFTRDFKKELKYSYVVRAVTPGEYVVPNVFAEAMYDPDIKGEYYEARKLIVKRR